MRFSIINLLIIVYVKVYFLMVSLRKYLALSGIIIIFASLLYNQPNDETNSEENIHYVGSLFLWLFGLSLIFLWAKKERSTLLRFSMVFVVIGQIIIWLLRWDSVYQNSFDSATISQLLWTILISWFIAGILTVIKKNKKYKYTERRGFSSYVKDEVLSRQNKRCAKCKRYLVTRDFDHKNGDRSNNDISNCQALCPNCHSLKSRKKW